MIERSNTAVRDFIPLKLVSVCSSTRGCFIFFWLKARQTKQNVENKKCIQRKLNFHNKFVVKAQARSSSVNDVFAGIWLIRCKLQCKIGDFSLNSRAIQFPRMIPLIAIFNQVGMKIRWICIAVFSVLSRTIICLITPPFFVVGSAIIQNYFVLMPLLKAPGHRA